MSLRLAAANVTTLPALQVLVVDLHGLPLLAYDTSVRDIRIRIFLMPSQSAVDSAGDMQVMRAGQVCRLKPRHCSTRRIQPLSVTLQPPSSGFDGRQEGGFWLSGTAIAAPWDRPECIAATRDLYPSLHALRRPKAGVCGKCGGASRGGVELPGGRGRARALNYTTQSA